MRIKNFLGTGYTLKGHVPGHNVKSGQSTVLRYFKTEMPVSRRAPLAAGTLPPRGGVPGGGGLPPGATNAPLPLPPGGVGAMRLNDIMRVAGASEPGHPRSLACALTAAGYRTLLRGLELSGASVPGSLTPDRKDFSESPCCDSDCVSDP